MDALPQHVDFATFAARANRAKGDAALAMIAGLNLVEGAKRIRRGGDGVYGEVPERPATKQVEAVGAWLRDLQREVDSGAPFYRAAEVREAVIAAAEEVDAAAVAMPAAERLRGALYRDALDVLGESAARPWLPWLIASLLGGVIVGMLLTRGRR